MADNGDITHMEIRQEIRALALKVEVLTGKVDGIPGQMDDVFIKNGFDPEDCIENQGLVHLVRKLAKAKNHVEGTVIKLISTVIVQFIISMVILGFAVTYVNRQTEAAILRNEQHIQKIIEKSKGK